MSDKPTRRSFFGQAGAALAAPLATTVALAGESDGTGHIAERLTALEDLNAIRVLQLTFARLVGAGSNEAIAALFAEPAHASINEHLRSVVIDGDDTIAISSDDAATARAPCIVTSAIPIENCDTLVEMARLQGDGVVKRSERRVLASSFVKRDGIWQFVNAELQA